LLHLDLYRLLPTTLLGILLSYLALSSGSILPAMLAHLCNNAILVVLAHGGFEEVLDHLGTTGSVLVVAASVLATAAGIGVARRSLSSVKL
jgi:membrane protease YdiL (CAAX protease family)